MGVCVKGMYLPPSCYFCPMTNDGLYICKANNPHKMLEDDCEERRPDWCPLTEVTEPHGDLIDRDALPTSRVEWEDIVNAPTIIKANESDMDSFIRIFKEDDEKDGMDSFIRILKD